MSIAVPMRKDVDDELSGLCEEIRSLYRCRVYSVTQRNRVQNGLYAHVSGALGYHSGMDKRERDGLWNRARDFVSKVLDGSEESDLALLVASTWDAVNVLQRQVDRHEKEMVKLASEMPVADWVRKPAQRGFSLLSLANIVGECGDLYNYDSPSKVWRRMGCAPFSKGDETLMGATWRGRIGNKQKLPTLSKAEWEEYGYCPRRASVRWMIGTNFIKLNGDGPYRRRWLEAKVKAFERHPEWNWTKCDKCGKGANGDGVCGTCGGTGKKSGRANNHGMLLASKLLLLNLWLEWTGAEWKEWRAW